MLNQQFYIKEIFHRPVVILLHINLQLSKSIDSDHLYYIYLASYSSPEDLSLESRYLVSQVLSFKPVQKP